MMKEWVLIPLCVLFASAMATASPENVSENENSDTTAVQPHGPVASTATAAATTAATAAATATSPVAGPTEASPAVDASASSVYVVEGGNKVDTKTLAGWKTWRALACERCHGAEQQGLVGPALVESLKILTKEEFHRTIMNGRPAKGMPPFSSSKTVTDNWEGLYAYLKGRSDGRIPPGRLLPLDSH